MATVADVLATKGTHVYAVAPTATVLDATRVMNRHKIGALVVTLTTRAFHTACPRMAASIEAAVREGRVTIGAEDGY